MEADYKVDCRNPIADNFGKNQRDLSARRLNSTSKEQSASSPMPKNVGKLDARRIVHRHQICHQLNGCLESTGQLSPNL